MTPTPKLTPAQRRVIDTLKAGGEWYGIDLVHAGAAGRGVIYVHLAELEDAGMVVSRKEADSEMGEAPVPRRRYQITEKGKSV